ncbi:hypothetical protein K438DRAFT_1783715 [Mycena galopus ATCC 62051]|nr:hypothetical protein K438DRAFT_1783715 [Mycena galopus ATCC 62051]
MTKHVTKRFRESGGTDPESGARSTEPVAWGTEGEVRNGRNRHGQMLEGGWSILRRPGGSGGLGGQNTGPGPRIRTGHRSGPGAWRAEGGGWRVEEVGECPREVGWPDEREGDDQRLSGSSGSPEVRIRCLEHGAESGARKLEDGIWTTGYGRERGVRADVLSGTSLYRSRPHLGDRVYTGSGGPGHMPGAEEGRVSDMVTVARLGEGRGGRRRRDDGEC